LTVEKKMSRSVVLSWSVPNDSLTPISQYHVCADGVVRAVVPGSFKCKALIEDIDLSKPVNVSVRAVTESGHSPDAACTVALGKDAPVAPQHVRVWSITPVAACVSWYPSNSNAEHVLLLNAVKVGVCPPSVFQVQLNGLSPSTIYRVSVRTKHPKAVLEQRPVERCVDFKTLPKIGLPDPPANVQVEMGPQPGTLLVSWTPVASQPLPPSRAAVHSYLVYADGRNIAQVPNATGSFHLSLFEYHLIRVLSLFPTTDPQFVGKAVGEQIPSPTSTIICLI
uniref:RIMS binding protein 2 n=1 Tax=Toxocara canis TaxID=6265 RepID=A0A183URU0_TOXCA